MFLTYTRKLVQLVALLGLLVALAGQARAEKYALLVGVRHYTSKDLKTLSFTEADMTGLAQALRANGFRPENVILMTDTTGATKGARFRPQSDSIRRELRQLLKAATAGDTVIVGFSGHGIQLRSTDEFYFCPADTDLSDRRTLVSLTELYKELERCPATLKLLLADACRTDPFRPAKTRAISDVESVTRPQARAVPGGVAAFFACSKGQEAYEDDNLRNGVFFHFVIEGLTGAAVSPGTKEVTLAGLQDYVSRKVSDYVRLHFNKDQVPELHNQTRLVTLVGGPEAADRRQDLRDLLVRGRALSRRGETEKALAFYDQAVRLDPSNAEAHACRADALNDKGEYDRALAACERALRLDPRLAVAQEYRADAFIGKRDYDQAARACAEALRLDPRLPGVYNDRGVLFALQGKPDKAVAELTKALELDPRYYQAYGNRASAYLELKEYDRAVTDYSEALRVGPRDPSAYFFRAQAHERLGHNEQARSDRLVAQQLGFKVARQ